MLILTDQTTVSTLLAGAFIFSTGLAVGWFMGVAARSKPEPRIADRPMSARGDAKPEWKGSR